MKKLLSFITVFALLLASSVPCLALEPQVSSNTIITDELDDGTIVTTTITVFESVARARSKDAYIEQDYKKSGQLIATVGLDVTFSFDGNDAWVKSANASHRTYQGWNYNDEDISTKGDTVVLTAELAKSGESTINVYLDASCTPDGVIS